MDKLGCSNGMTFSVDMKTFYHTDSLDRRITAYDYDPGSGDLGNPAIYYQGNEKQGFPDGITIDLDGNIWVAFWGEGCVRKISPLSEVVACITVPVIQPTSLMFGGENRDQLYMTSAATRASNPEHNTNEEGLLIGGPLFRIRTGSRGREEWPASL